MAVSPKWKAILLQFLHHLKAHTFPSSTRFQHRPQRFVHISASWKAQTFLIKKSAGTAAKYLEFVVPVYQLLWVLVGRLSFWPNVVKTNLAEWSGLRGGHPVGQLPIHRRGKWLLTMIRSRYTVLNGCILYKECCFATFLKPFLRHILYFFMTILLLSSLLSPCRSWLASHIF
jgi:hypothetical protein